MNQLLKNREFSFIELIESVEEVLFCLLLFTSLFNHLTFFMQFASRTKE